MARKAQPPRTASSRKPASVTAPAPAIDTDLLRTIAELVANSNLTEFEVEKGDLRIRAARAPRRSHRDASAPRRRSSPAAAAAGKAGHVPPRPSRSPPNTWTR